MERSSLELNLFNMEKESNCGPPRPAAKPPIFERKRSFRDIQRVVSKMNPEVLKSVINNASLDLEKYSFNSVPSTPTNKLHVPAPCDPTLRLSSFGYVQNVDNNAPMTIFYNGKVSVYHVSPYQAQEIMKLAEARSTTSNYTAESSETNSYNLGYLRNLYGDLPLARRKSLQRFLEKRKERLSMKSPYKL